MKGFHGGIEAVRNVLVGTNTMAYTCPDTTFGNDLDHSLINPNRLQYFGIPVWDNPYDPTHQMGIDFTVTDTIPFVTEGSTVFFETN